MAYRVFASVLCGLLFGVGLVISDMVNPARVLAFLDVTGAWDPSLAFVMGGAAALSWRASFTFPKIEQSMDRLWVGPPCSVSAGGLSASAPALPSHPS